MDELAERCREQQRQIEGLERRILELETAQGREEPDELVRRALAAEQALQDSNGRLHDIAEAWQQQKQRAEAMAAILREWSARFGREARSLDLRTAAALAEPKPKA